MPSSGCPRTDGFYYAHGSKNPGNVIGAKGNIDTKTPGLRCMPSSTFDTHNAAYVEVIQASGNYAQCGWVRERKEGQTQPTGPFLYFETVVGGVQTLDKGGNVSGSPEYKIEIFTGAQPPKIEAYYNGTLFARREHSTWGSPASIVDYSGEIKIKETCMPGTQASPCVFTGCQYKQVGGGYVDAGLTDADMEVSPGGSALWAAERLSASSMRIYDKRTQNPNCQG